MVVFSSIHLLSIQKRISRQTGLSTMRRWAWLLGGVRGRAHPSSLSVPMVTSKQNLSIFRQAAKYSTEVGVKTSNVFIRDCTLIHPLTLLLFAGKSLDIISQEGEKMVVGLEGKNWYSFEMSVQLCNLLRCVRQGIEETLRVGLITGRLGSLSSSHRLFLSGLNTFLTNNTNFD